MVRRRPGLTRRRSAYRSLASLQRDLRGCRACAEAGFDLESLPVVNDQLGQRAYMYGQAPGIVEGEERRPWRGRAGKTLRRWLELDEDEFYANVLLRVRDSVLSRTRRVRSRRPHTDSTRAGALLVLDELGARAGKPAADRRPSVALRSAACSAFPVSPSASAAGTSSTGRRSCPCLTLPAPAAGSTLRRIGS